MKKILVYPAILFCLLLSVQSCKKESRLAEGRVQQDEVITAAVAAGQTYIFNAGTTGTLIVNQQASHYQLSQAGIDSKNGAAIYTYTPAAGYTGADEVSLKHTMPNTGGQESSGGCHNGNHHNNDGDNNRIIVIKIAVTN